MEGLWSSASWEVGPIERRVRLLHRASERAFFQKEVRMLSHAEVLKRFFNGKKGTGSSLVSKGDVLLDYGWKKLAEFVEEIPEGFHAVENPEPPFLVLYQPYPSVTSSQHFSMAASYARYFGYLYICAMNRDFDVVLTKFPQDGKKIGTPFGEGVVNGTRIEVAREAQGIPYYLEIYPL